MPHFTEEEKKYIVDNHKIMSAPAMAKVMRRANMTIYDYLTASGLEAFRDKSKGVNHPFRKRNRQLETVCLKRRIESRKYNPK